MNDKNFRSSSHFGVQSGPMGQNSNVQHITGHYFSTPPMTEQAQSMQQMMMSPSTMQSIRQPTIQPSMVGHPAMVQPMTRGNSSTAQAMMRQPSTVQPWVMGQQSYVQPRMGQSTPFQPVMGQPVVGQPTSVQPMIGQPTSVQPMIGQPTSVQPMIGQPTSVQPMVGQPTSVRPVMGQPTSVQPMIGQPTSVQPMVGQPTSVQPTMGQPAFVRPMMGQSSNVYAVPQSVGSSWAPVQTGVPNTTAGYQGDAHRVVQIDPLQVHRQQKLSEKQEWFRIQKERLQSSKVKANVTNPVDRMFGEKDPQTLPVAVTLKQEEPPVCEEDVSPVANVVSVSSVKDVSETQHEETKSSTAETTFNKIFEQSMNLQLDTPPMKKKQQFKSTKTPNTGKQTQTVFSSSMKSREWKADVDELRGLFTEDDFGEFSSAEATTQFTDPPTQFIAGGTSILTAPTESKPSMIPSQSHGVQSSIPMLSVNVPVPGVNQPPVMSEKVLPAYPTPAPIIEKTASSGETTFSIPGSWLHDMSVLPQVYHDVYKRASVPESAFLDTAVITQLFQSSNLPRPVLKDIWNEVNKSYKGKLLKEEMVMALALIALAQGGVKDLTCESLVNLTNAPVPHLTAVIPSTSSTVPTEKSTSEQTAILNTQKPFVAQFGMSSPSTAEEVKSLINIPTALKCLEICGTVVHSTLEVVLKASASILSEITGSSEGREKLLGVNEVQKIAMRIALSFPMDKEIQKKKMSIESEWVAVLNTSEMIKKTIEPPRSQSTYECSMHSCGLCSNSHVFSPCVPDMVDFKGCSCHVSCVNFWNTFIGTA